MLVFVVYELFSDILYSKQVYFNNRQCYNV